MKRLITILFFLPFFYYSQKNLSASREIVDIFQIARILMPADTNEKFKWSLFGVDTSNTYPVDSSNKNLLPKDLNKIINSVFGGELIKSNKVKTALWTFDTEIYNINPFNFYKGVCNSIALYGSGKEFLILEMGFDKIFPKLKHLKKVKEIKLIQKFYRPVDYILSTFYVFKYKYFAIWVVTVSESQQVGSNFIKKNDIMLLNISTINTFNLVWAPGQGIPMLQE